MQKVMKIFHQKGFTLTELVVVVSIMGVLGLIFTDILIQTLRGENKVKLLSQVKQTGQVALDNLANNIRQAERVICVGDSNTSGGIDDTIVVYNSGIYSRFRFKPATSTKNGYIAGDTFSMTDYPVSIQPLEYCTRALQPLTFNVTDTDPVTGVSIASDSGTPIFKLNSQAGYNDNVTITFRVFQGIFAGQTYENSVPPEGILFSTTIQVRGTR